MQGTRNELQKMASEYGFIILYHNRQWRIANASAKSFHEGGHFTGTLKQCMVWLAGYAMGRESAERELKR